VGPEKSDSLHRWQRQEKNRQNRLGLVVSLLWRSNGHTKLMGLVTSPDFLTQAQCDNHVASRGVTKKKKENA
jgi:hypothetical protein